jgi:hypothetical protein
MGYASSGVLDFIQRRVDQVHKERGRFLIYGNLDIDTVHDNILLRFLNDERIPKSRRIIVEESAKTELHDFFQLKRSKTA